MPRLSLSPSVHAPPPGSLCPTYGECRNSPGVILLQELWRPACAPRFFPTDGPPAYADLRHPEGRRLPMRPKFFSFFCSLTCSDTPPFWKHHALRRSGRVRRGVAPHTHRATTKEPTMPHPSGPPTSRPAPPSCGPV